MASVGSTRFIALSIAVFAILVAGCEARRSSSDTEAASTVDRKPVEQPLVVEVYTDLVCPFCFIGTERLDRAIAASGLQDRVVLRHRSYLLRPDTPPEGIDIHAYLRERTGRDPSESFGRIEAMAKEVGLDLDLSKQRINPPTIYAHALLHEAGDRGTQRALERDLYRAHFIEAVNISDPSVLASIASAHGFSEDEVRRIISDENVLTAVRQESTAGRQRGVRGVPFFIFPDGNSISGAQSEEVLRAALERAAQAVGEGGNG